MQVYKRTQFNLIKGIIIAPVTGVVFHFIAQMFIPDIIICSLIGLAAAGALLYIALFGENIYFELDNDGAFRYYKWGKPEQTFTLGQCRVSYRRKNESGFFGSYDIKLKIRDDKTAETIIDASALGGDQFTEMFAKMEKYAIKDEPVKPGTAGEST